MRYPKSCLLFKVKLLMLGVILCAPLGFTTTTQASDKFTLVTKQEHEQFLNTLKDTPNQTLQSKTALPIVVVESPLLDDGDIQGPIDIIVRFTTSADATIDMGSLRILYGFFMDITDRILENADMQQDSFTVRNADIPKGKHSFTIRIKDSLGRTAEKKINVVIT